MREERELRVRIEANAKQALGRRDGQLWDLLHSASIPLFLPINAFFARRLLFLRRADREYITFVAPMDDTY